MAEAILKNVLVVDDEQSVRDYLDCLLTSGGYHCQSFSDSKSALTHLHGARDSVGLILADLEMPGMKGLDLLRSVKVIAPGLPVIILSANYEFAAALEALHGGAADYLLKPAPPGDILALVAKHLTTLTPGAHEQIAEALHDFAEARKGLDSNAATALQDLFQMMGFKRFETFQHSCRVASFARLVGEELGLTGAALDSLELGAGLHDIGKAAIPRNVLMKPGPLNGEEWRVMKMHPLIGRELLASIPSLAREAEIVHCHHERIDGKGYPRGLKLEEIPLGARIFSVVDTLDAITSDRPYRARQTVKAAREEIDSMTGTQFDPEVVACFRRIPDEAFDEIRRRHPD